MKKYKTSTFYELSNGMKFCIATNMQTGESKLIGQDGIVINKCKYDKINRFIAYMEELESLQIEIKE